MLGPPLALWTQPKVFEILAGSNCSRENLAVLVSERSHDRGRNSSQDSLPAILMAWRGCPSFQRGRTVTGACLRS